jgi:hypothetical protein
MTAAVEISSNKIFAERPPGFLLAPLGWAAERLMPVLQQDPALLADVVHLSRSRMHLIAIAFAHLDGAVQPELGKVLLCGSAREILDAVIGRRPIGLKRVARRLPERVLEVRSYRRLLQLLDDQAAAKLLHHADQIDDAAIKVVDNTPPSLRSVAFTMHGWCGDMASLPEGLQYLADRGAAPSFDALVADLALVRQPEQFMAKIKCMVDALPLPEALPPIQVGNARRLDHAAEIRALAKSWRNCLENYIWRVDGGECAIYLWEDGHLQAACLVRRRGRLGWFLDEAKGPRNAEIELPRWEPIVKAFGSIGIPPYLFIKAVEDIVDIAGVRGLRRRRRVRIAHDEESDDDVFLDVA